MSRSMVVVTWQPWWFRWMPSWQRWHLCRWRGMRCFDLILSRRWLLMMLMGWSKLMLMLRGMRVHVKTRGTYWSNRPRRDKMRQAMMRACSRRMLGLMMRVWQCLLGVFGLVSLSWVRFTRSSPPPQEDDGTMNRIRIVRLPGGAISGPLMVAGNCLSDGSSPTHIHQSRRQLTLVDTATAPGLPRWPIPGRVVDHLQRYQVGAANIQSPSLWHDDNRMTLSVMNFFIYLAIVASVSKNKRHLVANFQPYIFVSYEILV